MTDKTESKGQSSGPATDRQNVPVEDPTANVIAIVQGEVRRADDLRAADHRYAEEMSKHVRNIADLRAYYDERLREAEAKRIDAIRAVDVGAVQVASDRQTQAAGVLATQLQATVEANRVALATTAAALAEQLQQIVKPIGERLTSLEKAQNELSGRTGALDPQAVQLTAEVRSMREAIALGAGAKQGGVEFRTEQRSQTGMTLAIIGGVFGFIGVVGTIISVVILVTR